MGCSIIALIEGAPLDRKWTLPARGQFDFECSVCQKQKQIIFTGKQVPLKCICDQNVYFTSSFSSSCSDKAMWRNRATAEIDVQKQKRKRAQNSGEKNSKVP